MLRVDERTRHSGECVRAAGPAHRRIPLQRAAHRPCRANPLAGVPAVPRQKRTRVLAQPHPGLYRVRIVNAARVG